MNKIAGFVGMTVGGTVGWYAGSWMGFMTGFMLSCVGSGIGLYIGRRVVQQYLALVLGLTLIAAPATNAQTQAPSPGAQKAAQELMLVMHADKTLHDAISASFDAQVQANPALAPYRGAMQQFADKYITWEAIGPQLAATYAETFTEGELKDLIAFYKTPTGQKMAAQVATLSAKGQQIGLQAVQAHQAELMDMLRQQQNKQQTSPADTTHH